MKTPPPAQKWIFYSITNPLQPTTASSFQPLVKGKSNANMSHFSLIKNLYLVFNYRERKAVLKPWDVSGQTFSDFQTESPEEAADCLCSNRACVTDLLLPHVLPGAVDEPRTTRISPPHQRIEPFSFLMEIIRHSLSKAESFTIWFVLFFTSCWLLTWRCTITAS